ncbi:porin [Alphaproteobacteria bacterium KMM 3653]|uniref:Porin n=1 Tax=Harenicola maris TaxID=2841044 RepID=A0AAP2CRF1_9RHOB|nr:porin [Harenicola maris]
MKKILLTSTALVAFAGAAAAEVSISGSAEMGIFGTDSADTQFHTDVDVTFSMSGETDGGLSFGASVDLDEAAGLGFEEGNAGFAVFISGGFGTITMGDTDGAMDWALTEAGNVGNPGSLRDDETSHAGYWGSYHDGAAGVYDNQVLRYDNTFGDFGVALSFEQVQTGGESDIDMAWALGVKYDVELAGLDLALGLGYQSVNIANTDGDDDSTIVGMSATTTFDNGLSAGLTYVSGDIFGVSDSSHFGLGFGYATGAVSLHANYGKYDLDGFEVEGFGLAAAYDLGGGASVNFGYGSSDGDAFAESFDTYSLGLVMSF